MTSLGLDMRELVSRVREEVGAYNSFGAILEKAEHDRYLKIFSESFKKIFEEEINFAYCGWVIRTRANEERLDAENQRRESSAHQYVYLQTELEADRRSRAFAYQSM